MAFLEISNVYKSFGSVNVLNDVGFTLDKGEVLSIIGASGSGKTTLLRCLNMLESADKGRFLLDGRVMFDGPLGNYKESEKREKQLFVGLVFQSFNLFPHYSVLKNLTLAPELLLQEGIKNKGKKGFNPQIYQALNEFYFGTPEADEANFKARIQKKAVELLTNVGLESKIDAYPHQLSGGQQQRAAIARALALNPALLCFDEPTSALDPELTGEVLKAIRALKSEDRTMIIVTHEMGFARNVSDKIVFMADGVIEEAGTPAEIFDTPKSDKLKIFLSAITDKEN